MPAKIHNPDDVTTSWLSRHKNVSATKWDMPYAAQDPLAVIGARGDYIYPPSGEPVLDWNNGILCTILDPQTRELLAAIMNQLRTGVHHTSSTALNDPLIRLKEKTAEALREWGDFVILPASSGSIADDMAIRAALSTVGERNVRYIIPEMGYSGAHFRGSAMCGWDVWKGGSTPRISGVQFIPPEFEDIPPFDPAKQVKAGDIEKWFQLNVDGNSPAESPVPIVLAEAGELGVGGFRRMTSEWMLELTRATKRRGGIFICDSVQTFPGRTGDGYWGFERWVQDKEDVPDIIPTAKGLGNGWPIGLVAIRRDIAEKLDGKWFDTFGGNPIASRVAEFVLKRTREPDITSNMRERSIQLREGFAELQRSFGGLVRGTVGAGLMSGLAVAPDKLAAIHAHARAEGLWLALGADGTVRAAPHFDTSPDAIDEGLRKLGEAIKKAA